MAAADEAGQAGQISAPYAPSSAKNKIPDSVVEANLKEIEPSVTDDKGDGGDDDDNGDKGDEEDGDEEDGDEEDTLPSNRYLVLASRPCQELEKEAGYDVEKNPKTGLVTLTHPKRFGRTEKWVHRFLGGPKVLRRPLDVYGTRLWELCDGKHSLAKIIEMMEGEFHEAIHPASSRIQKLVEFYVRLGFVKLLPPDPGVLMELSSAMKTKANQTEENDSSDNITTVAGTIPPEEENLLKKKEDDKIAEQS